MNYGLLITAVIAVHAAFAGFVLVAQLLIVVGGICRWSWVRNLWFRRIHLACIAFVVLESWLGIACPLTVLEAELRKRAGQRVDYGNFIEAWLEKYLYYDLPTWLFTVIYTLFGLLVLASWYWFPPIRPHRTGESPSTPDEKQA